MADTDTRDWPVGGYAPGMYMGRCRGCGEQFVGDKRASRCLPCAALEMKEFASRLHVALRLIDQMALPRPASPLTWTHEAAADAYGQMVTSMQDIASRALRPEPSHEEASAQ